MPETIDFQTLLTAVDHADSVETLVDAVKAVAETGRVEALPTLLAALNFNNPGAAVAAVDGFVLIGEPAVEPLLALLGNQNYGARAWALRALAGIGDPRALDLLMETAQYDHALSVRRAAARGLGTIRWQLVPPERLALAQQAVLQTLQAVMADPEWVVRYAAITGLQSLAESLAATLPHTVPMILDLLRAIASQDPDLAVQTRARMAQKLLAKLSQSILFSDSDGPMPPTVKGDWQVTLDQLYRRKSDERRPMPAEGDPQQFRQVAAQLQAQRMAEAKKKHPWLQLLWLRLLCLRLLCLRLLCLRLPWNLKPVRLKGWGFA